MSIQKYTSIFIAALMASGSVFAAQQWYQVQNKSASDFTFDSTTTDYMLQFNGPGTFTVDESLTAYSINPVFGSSTTNVSPATIQINEGVTFKITRPGTNTARPSSIITFQGDGTLQMSQGSIIFIESGPNLATTGGDDQYYYFNMSTALNLGGKTIEVRNKNYVEIANLAMTTKSTINLTGTSSFKATTSSAAKFVANVAATSQLIIQSSTTVQVQDGSVFADGSQFKFMNTAGTALAPSATYGSTTIGDVLDSKMGATVYFEDGATININAGTKTLQAQAIVIKQATVNLNTSNAMYYGSSQADINVSFARANAKLNLGADNAFNNLRLYKSGSNAAATVFVSLGGNAFTLNQVSIDSDESMMYFTDFAADLVRVNTTVATEADGSLKNIFSVTLDGVGEIESYTKLYQTEAGYFTAIAPVPEPATFAILLGALALGFAYRRRK